MDPHVEQVLQTFTDAARAAFGDALRSVVLFGSAAEDRLRPVSDVNVLVVLHSFDPAKAQGLRDELRLARAAASLRPMFVLDSEIAAAGELFAVKFGDVARRHRVLVGDDPFAGAAVTRAARIVSLRQMLLNLSMRLRERFVSVPDDGHAAVVAEFVSTARAAAAEWLALRDGSTPSPREALIRAATELGGGKDAAWLATISAAREGREVAPADAHAAMLGLAELTTRLSSAADGLAR